jgi:hypothetical protein
MFLFKSLRISSPRALAKPSDASLGTKVSRLSIKTIAGAICLATAKKIDSVALILASLALVFDDVIRNVGQLLSERAFSIDVLPVPDCPTTRIGSSGIPYLRVLVNVLSTLLIPFSLLKSNSNGKGGE